MSETKPPDPDAEREVDLRSAWTRITARWYLPVAGLVIGAILGVLASVGGGEVFRATDAPLPRPALHDLGRRPDPEHRDEPEDGEPDHPLARPRSGRPSEASGLTLGQLRGRVTSQAVVTAGQARNISPLVEITVDAAAAHKAEKAADSLANSVIGVVSTYVDQKIELLNKQIALEQGPSSPTSTRACRAPSSSSRR